ncbi:hypothetical protein TSOC_006207, partial [Tetrabaena socialis]
PLPRTGLLSALHVEAIPIFKLDVEGFEFPIMAEWTEQSRGLPEQIAVELHYIHTFANEADTMYTPFKVCCCAAAACTTSCRPAMMPAACCSAATALPLSISARSALGGVVDFTMRCSVAFSDASDRTHCRSRYSPSSSRVNRPSRSAVSRCGSGSGAPRSGPRSKARMRLADAPDTLSYGDFDLKEWAPNGGQLLRLVGAQNQNPHLSTQGPSGGLCATVDDVDRTNSCALQVRLHVL